MAIDEIFQQLAALPRWVSWHLKLNGNKLDKIPHNGQHGLSTSEPNDWLPLINAQTLVAEWYGLAGVGS